MKSAATSIVNGSFPMLLLLVTLPADQDERGDRHAWGVERRSLAALPSKSLTGSSGSAKLDLEKLAVGRRITVERLGTTPSSRAR